MKHVLNVKGVIGRYGLSMKGVAERMGVTAASLSQKSNSIRTDTAMKIAEAIGCDLFELWDTYDDDGVLIPFSELYPKRNEGEEMESQSTKEVKPTDEDHQSDLFHQPGGDDQKEITNVDSNTGIGYLNNLTTHNKEEIAGYGKCPKCGARFRIILDE